MCTCGKTFHAGTSSYPKRRVSAARLMEDVAIHHGTVSHIVIYQLSTKTTLTALWKTQPVGTAHDPIIVKCTKNVEAELTDNTAKKLRY